MEFVIPRLTFQNIHHLELLFLRFSLLILPVEKKDKVNTDNLPGILNVSHQWFLKRAGKDGWDTGSHTFALPGTG